MAPGSAGKNHPRAKKKKSGTGGGEESKGGENLPPPPPRRSKPGGSVVPPGGGGVPVRAKSAGQQEGVKGGRAPRGPGRPPPPPRTAPVREVGFFAWGFLRRVRPAPPRPLTLDAAAAGFAAGTAVPPGAAGVRLGEGAEHVGGCPRVCACVPPTLGPAR